jgi:hypothetical protein
MIRATWEILRTGNPLWNACGVLMVGAGLWGYRAGNWKQATVALLYAAANFIIATIKG